MHWLPRPVARLVTAALGLTLWAPTHGVGATEPPYVRAVGTVQDGGFPDTACSCERCEAALADPTLRRHVASLALVLPGPEGTPEGTPGGTLAPEIWLIDATPDLRQQIGHLRAAGLRPNAPDDRIDRSPVDGVLLTHAHMGHYLGLAFFGFEDVNTRQLPVVATPRMAEFLRTNGPWSQLVELENIRLREIESGSRTTLGPVEVTLVPAPHRDEFSDTVGYLLEGPAGEDGSPGRRLLYVPDTDSWPAWGDRLEPLFDSIDLLVVDGTFYSPDELPGRSVASIGHPLITDTMDRLQERVRAGKLAVWFTHLNHSNPALTPGSPERREIERRGFRVLAEGEEIPLLH